MGRARKKITSNPNSDKPLKECGLQLKKIRDDYIESLIPIKERIENIEQEIEQNQLDLKGKNNDILVKLQSRLSILKTMSREIHEISTEANNYYEMSWWRSERYTMNRRLSKKPKYYMPNYFEEAMVERVCPEDEEYQEINTEENVSDQEIDIKALLREMRRKKE